MSSKRDREASIEHLLRRLRPGRIGSPPPDTGASCLDADVVAAWADGTLGGHALAAAEAHVADCSRCLALVAAMARTDPSPAAGDRRSWGLTLRWLAPLAAAATAVAVWVAVPRNEPPVPESAPIRTEAPASRQSKEQLPATPNTGEELRARRDGRLDEPKDRSANTPSEQLQARAENVAPRTENIAPKQEDAAVDNVGRLADATNARPAAAPPADARENSAPERTLGRSRPVAATAKAMAIDIVIVSPDPLVRWRIAAAGVVQRSTNGGSTWEALSTGVNAELTAGASPSPSVCWLVGRAGTVLLSTDGRQWQPVSFPERADLIAVRASDARTASVTTADGLTYSTANGGLTWDR